MSGGRWKQSSRSARASPETAPPTASTGPWEHCSVSRGEQKSGHGLPEGCGPPPAAPRGLGRPGGALLDRGQFTEARAATARLARVAGRGGEPPGRAAAAASTSVTRWSPSRPASLRYSPAKDLRSRAFGSARPSGVVPEVLRTTATAAKFYEASLATEPSLADDLEAGHRFHAACAAALAARGVGEDAMPLDDRRRAALRRQALGWLTAEYDAWAERHRLGKPGDRTAAATAVRSWRHDDDLAGFGTGRDWPVYLTTSGERGRRSGPTW